ncbi:MAG TPA: glycerol kinase GlpK [Thermomicrobiales bacterium]|nr:glycerol kinase GlpK [Thermomicrobiales bacterium]
MSTAQLILAIDQGTTSSRAMLFDRHGVSLAACQAEITQIFPQPGWVNHDATEIWDTTLRVTRDVLAETETGSGAIAAIGITNQRETTLIWDRGTGRPVAPAIVWQSRQSAPLVTDIVKRGMAETYQHITGLVPDAYFSATKLAWLLAEDSGLRKRAERGELAAGTIDSWLVWNLTGGRVHATDYSNAARTMLFDIRALQWSDLLLADLDIPRSLLPEVVSNSGLIGMTEPDLFGTAIPIAGMAGDQQSALFGQACFAPGEAKNTYGTGSFLLMQTGTEAIASRNRLLTTIAWGIDGVVNYALEGSIFVTGSAVQWLRDGLGIIQNASEVEPLADSVPDANGVHFVPALTGLGAPYWDSDARGIITGLTRGATAAHLARATLESIAFQSRDVLEAMQADAGIGLAELRVDGGASRNDLLMQIQANVLGVPVVRPQQVETTVLGAAYLAGLGVGLWSHPDDVRESWAVERRFEPNWSDAERASRYAAWLDAVARCRS